MKNKKNMKAQAAVIGLIFAFMLIAAASIMQPVLLDFIAIGVNETNVSGAAHSTIIITIIQAIPLFLWLIILVAVVALITGRSS